MDYKDRIQARAEEIAQDEYYLDFYQLLPEVMDKIYERAMEDVVEDYCDAADRL